MLFKGVLTGNFLLLLYAQVNVWACESSAHKYALNLRKLLEWLGFSLSKGLVLNSGNPIP